VPGVHNFLNLVLWEVHDITGYINITRMKCNPVLPGLTRSNKMAS
jgi:hypothetical protein